MSAREIVADLQDVALMAGALRCEREPGSGRHGSILLVVLPAGRTLRYPIANKVARGHGKNRDNAIAMLKRIVRRAVTQPQQ